MKKTLLTIFLMTTFTSYLCAAIPTLPKTLDKKASVVIKSDSKKQIIDVLTSEMLARGYVVKDISEYKAVYSKVEKDPKSQLIFGRHSSTENWISYDMVETPAGIQVVLTSEMVGNPGSGRENRFDYSYYEHVVNSWKEVLNALKLYIENPK